MKQRVASPAALSILQPVTLVCSQVVLETLPLYHSELATDQSRLTRPHGCCGKKYVRPLGWMTVDWVKFQVGSQVGGAQGRPLSAHVGEDGGGSGE
jgi:hypothetical protein